MGCLRFIVKGRVQGVWYRKYTSENFNRAGMVGYVKNLPNGDVEIIIKGEKDRDMDKILEIIERGSPDSEVNEIELGECDENTFNFSDKFEVRK
jgi:acylphosphatase